MRFEGLYIAEWDEGNLRVSIENCVLLKALYNNRHDSVQDKNGLLNKICSFQY